MPYVDYFSVALDKKNTGKKKTKISKNYLFKKTLVGHGMIILPPNYSPNVTIASYPVIVSM